MGLAASWLAGFENLVFENPPPMDDPARRKLMSLRPM
jgi:hypothetical protein